MFLDKYHQKLADYETKAKESIKKSTKSTSKTKKTTEKNQIKVAVLPAIIVNENL